MLPPRVLAACFVALAPACTRSEPPEIRVAPASVDVPAAASPSANASANTSTSATPTASTTAAASATATATASAPATAGGSTSALHCFSWVHGPDFSTDCFRSETACAKARQDMKNGARDATECARVDRGSCTKLERDGSERCFGSANACERYRAFIRGNGLASSACTPS